MDLLRSFCFYFETEQDQCFEMVHLDDRIPFGCSYLLFQ